jgi:hypothetical protein
VAANVDAYVRHALTPLAELAERTGCAVASVRHLTKRGADRALLRGQGSIGIAAAVRAGLFAARRADDPERRVLAVSKTNLARTPPALGYRIIQTAEGLPLIEWTGPADLSADALSRPAAATRPRDAARDWLRRALLSGPRRASDLSAEASAAGIPWATLRRAKADLGVSSHRVHDPATGRGEWYWSAPAAA